MLDQLAASKRGLWGARGPPQYVVGSCESLPFSERQRGSHMTLMGLMTPEPSESLSIRIKRGMEKACILILIMRIKTMRVVMGAERKKRYNFTTHIRNDLNK